MSNNVFRRTVAVLTITLATLLGYLMIPEPHRPLPPLVLVKAAGLAAFPGAMGAGAVSAGGRGGVVYNITTLSDTTNAGCMPNSLTLCSLRDCLQASGARNCIFRVGGIINVNGDLRFGNGFLTVAGQTAPGGGIKLAGTGAVMWVNGHDVIIRYIGYDGNSANNGPSAGSVSFDAGSGTVYNVIFDHVSGFHVTNKQLIVLCNDAGPVHDVTFQWSMTYKPDVNHPVGPMADATTCQAITVTNIDYHHNFFADTSHRLPLFNARSGRWVSNIVYNWDWFGGLWQGANFPDIIDNNYIHGNMNIGDNGGHPHQFEFTSTQSTDDTSQSMQGPPSPYLVGNIGLQQSNPTGDQTLLTGQVNSEGGAEVGAVPVGWFRGSPLAAETFPIVPDPAATLVAVLLPTVGNSQMLDCLGNLQPRRQTEDAAMINEFQGRANGSLWTAPAGYVTAPVANGTPCTESLNDGIPDQWKVAKGLSTTDTNLYKTVAPNGDTWLNNYLNGGAAVSGGGGGTNTTLTITNITVTNITSTSATINWTTSNPANSTVNYGICSNLKPTPTNPTNVLMHSVNLIGLTASTIYTFNVESFDGTTTLTSGNSIFTTTAAPGGGTPGQPLAPMALSSSAPTQAFQLQWSPSPTVGVTSYKIYRSTTSGTGFVLKAQVTSTPWVDTAVTAGQTLYYVVTAVCPGCTTQESAFSNQIVAVIP